MTEIEICGERFPIDVGGWGKFVCSLPAGHEGNHIAKLSVGIMQWWNEKDNPQKEESNAKSSA